MATCTRISLLCCLLLSLTSIALAGGKRDYGEECSITGSIGNIFRSDANDDKDACNSDKNLICAGKCTCSPAHVYEKTGFLSIINGGKCVIRANLPCQRDSTCVQYATCGDNTISYCKCVEGYYEKEGHCTNSGAQLLLNSFYIVGLIASYFMLA